MQIAFIIHTTTSWSSWWCEVMVHSSESFCNSIKSWSKMIGEKETNQLKTRWWNLKVAMVLGWKTRKESPVPRFICGPLVSDGKRNWCVVFLPVLPFLFAQLRLLVKNTSVSMVCYPIKESPFLLSQHKSGKQAGKGTRSAAQRQNYVDDNGVYVFQLLLCTCSPGRMRIVQDILGHSTPVYNL